MKLSMRKLPFILRMNRKAERKNKTYFELVVAILLNSRAASHWWGEVLLTVCYVLNRVPNSKGAFGVLLRM